MVSTNVTIDNTNPAIQYLPIADWSEGSITADPRGKEYFNQTFTLTTGDKAHASFTFNGTGIWIYGAKRSNHGTYSVTLDGSTNDFNGKDTNDVIQATLFSATSLQQGLHTVNVTNTQKDNYLDIDYITYTREVDQSNEALNTTLAEDTDKSAFTFSPESSWTTSTSGLQGFSSNTAHATFEDNASVLYKFSGDAVAIYGAIGPNAGPYTASIDGGQERSFNASKTTYTAQVLLYEANGLGPGEHYAKLTNKPGNFGQSLSIDYAIVTDPEVNSSGNPSNSSESSGISGGAIAGIVVGALAVLAIIGLLIFFFRRRKRVANSDYEKPDVFGAGNNSHMSPYSDHPPLNGRPTPPPIVTPFRANSGSGVAHEPGVMGAGYTSPSQRTQSELNNPWSGSQTNSNDGSGTFRNFITVNPTEPVRSEHGRSSSSYSGVTQGVSVANTSRSPNGYPNEKGARVLNVSSPSADNVPSGSGGPHTGGGGLVEEGREMDAGPLPPSYNQATYRP